MELFALFAWGITRIIVLFRFDFLSISSSFCSIVRVKSFISQLGFVFLMNGGVENLCFHPVLAFGSPLRGITISCLVPVKIENNLFLVF